MEPRPYQEKAISNTLSDIKSRQYRSTVLVLPTGGGKTFTASQILKDLVTTNTSNQEVIVWLVHREELLKQATSALEAAGLDIAHWNANTKSVGKIIIAMVASSRALPERLHSMGLFCKYMVIDEAHRRAAPSYKALEEALNPEFTLLLTATPIRMDELDLDFDKVSFEVSFLDLVEQKYLAKPRYISYRTGLAFKLRAGGDDFASEDLKALNNEKRNEIIAKDYGKNRAEYGKSLIFCIDVEHCHDLERAFHAHCPGVITAVLTGDTNHSIRAKIIEEFRKGIIDVVLNVAVLTEGYDEPSIKSILLARPTRSEVLWAQMIGRGSRPHATKPHFNIVDYVDGENNYGILAEDWAVRLLGVEESPESIERKENALTADLFKQWINTTGYSGKIPKEKREILEIDGVLTIATKTGERRFLVRKQHRPRLDRMVNAISKRPPAKNQAMQEYIEGYANKFDKSLLRWPGKTHLLSMAWALYYKFVLNRAAKTGKPAWVYKPIPDFSAVGEDNEREATVRTTELV